MVTRYHLQKDRERFLSSFDKYASSPREEAYYFNLKYFSHYLIKLISSLSKKYIKFFTILILA